MTKNKKIFVVEDDKEIAGRINTYLQHEGYVTTEINNGSLALEKIKEECPDIVVLDVMLPGLDGLTICRQIRNNPETSHIAVILLTARGEDIDKIVGLEVGADYYMVKPFALGELLARVRALLRRSPKDKIDEDNSLISNDIRLDILGRRLYKGKVLVKISNKEFDMLEFLMRNKEIVLTRDLILTKVWGYDSFVDKRTVDVHIRWVREKIESDPSNPERILTVRGVGYKFQD